MVSVGNSPRASSVRRPVPDYMRVWSERRAHVRRGGAYSVDENGQFADFVMAVLETSQDGSDERLVI